MIPPMKTFHLSRYNRITDPNFTEKQPAAEPRTRRSVHIFAGVIVGLTIAVIIYQTCQWYKRDPTPYFKDPRWVAENIKGRELLNPQNELDFDTTSDEANDYIFQFNKFVKKYKKQYKNSAEYRMRFGIYVKHMRELEVQSETMGFSSAQYGENHMSDMTEEEFSRMLLPKGSFEKMRQESTFIKQKPPMRKTANAKDYPDFLDWRMKNVVTPVKAQGQCGSCWAFATAATVESAYAVGHGQLLSLSEQELLDCNLENDACDGGDVDKALKYIQKNGLMTEEDYPYKAKRQDQCMIHGNTTFIKEAYFLNQTEEAMLDWLVNHGPVNIGMSVIQDMRSYTGGVFSPSAFDCENKVIGLHSMLVVGYGTVDDTGEKYWIIKNSWGQTYGIDNGYILFVRGKNACGVEDEPIGVLA